jgi:preprotein translocase subunit SecD
VVVLVRWIATVAVVSACSSEVRHAVSPHVEFRLVDRAGAPGSTVHRVRGDTATISARPEVLLSGSDIVTAKARTRTFWLILSPRTQKIHEVVLTITPDAATRLGRATASAVGEELAMIIDGDVASRLLIREPLGTEQLIVAGQFTKADVRALAEALKR